ncbi:uncharacterized protein LOC122642204 [Telopea speciosissima]|uniref:uncharacterized protein LOC122642204 n=1 Tax=Telopea speciosissima TaxID=54955 RepID=UPI001CC7A6DB|nr:uncharacterized protein LOC122642204 [Telopea speciosissima]
MDPNLPTAWKFLIQITGAPQVKSAIVATLHYQICYRLQNHAFDLNTGHTSNDSTLFLHIGSDQTPTVTHVPRQLSRADIFKLVPDSWVSAYESTHEVQPTPPLVATDPTYKGLGDGRTEITFPKPTNMGPLFASSVSQLDPRLDAPITSFDAQGNPVYRFQSPTSHKYFDVCDCPDCLDDSDDAPPVSPRRQRRKQRSKDPLWIRYQ